MAEGKVRVDLSVHDQATPELKKANRELKHMRKEFKELGHEAFEPLRKIHEGLSDIISPLGALTAGLSAAGIFEGLKHFAEQGEQIKLLSQQVGMASDQFQELGFAAKMAGMDSDTFTGSMQKMLKNIGEMAHGEGTLYEVFHKTNPEFVKQLLAAKSSKDQFLLLMDAINHAKTSTEKMMIATEAFGRSGYAMINLAARGTKTLRDDMDAYAKSGAVVSEKTQDQSEKFNDSLKLLSASWSGVTNLVGSQTIPIFTKLIEQFSAWFQANQKMIGQNISAFVTGFSNAISAIPWGELVTGTKVLFHGLGKLVDMLGGPKGVVFWIKALAIYKMASWFSGLAAGAYEAVKAAMAFREALKALSVMEAIADAFNPFAWIPIVITGLAMVLLNLKEITSWFEHTAFGKEIASWFSHGQAQGHDGQKAASHPAPVAPAPKPQHTVHHDIFHHNASPGTTARSKSTPGTTVSHHFVGSMAPALGGF